MTDHSVDSPRRRNLLVTVSTGVIAYGAGTSPTAAQSNEIEAVEATLNNVGLSAWKVTETTDNELAETGVDNPELSLRVGARYTFQNDGWSTHPLAFLDSDGDPLLSQGEQGSFEGDSSTDWVDNDTSVSFTVTSELADELDSYICTIHSSMEGPIRTVQQSSTDDPADVTMSDQSTDGTSVTVDSARLNEGGFVTIHDSSLNKGETIPHHPRDF
jgi:plastocyanin